MLRGKHCRRPIAVKGVADHFGPYQSRKSQKLILFWLLSLIFKSKNRQ